MVFFGQWEPPKFTYVYVKINKIESCHGYIDRVVRGEMMV